jgi:predicted phosphodiesterase
VKLAVISDVHANLPAFEAVLADADAQGVERVVCLGDVVGYNAFPAEAIALLRRRGIASVQGNHDLMAVRDHRGERCGPRARHAIEWTRRVLAPAERDYLRALPDRLLLDEGVLLVHAGLEDPTLYLTTAEQFVAQRAAIGREHPSVGLCLTGHTHTAGTVSIGEHGVESTGPEPRRLAADRFLFVNPGSVGGPRGEDYRASYAIVDGGAGEVRFRKVPYDAARVRAENTRQGLATDLGPGVLAHRASRVGHALRQLVRRVAGRDEMRPGCASLPRPVPAFVPADGRHEALHPDRSGS